MILHAGLVALHHPGGWRGALIHGPSGAGKSDLALRCLSEGFRLVADDRVLLWTSGGGLFGRAPEPLHGLIEVRGQGVGLEPALVFCRVSLVARCTPPGEIERVPGPQVEALLGVTIPRIDISPLEASAPAKLRRALSGLG